MTKRHRNVLFEFQAYFVREFYRRRHGIVSQKKEFCEDMKFFRQGGTIPMQFYSEICMPLLLRYLDINQEELKQLMDKENPYSRGTQEHEDGSSDISDATNSVVNDDANSILQRFTRQESGDEDVKEAALGQISFENNGDPPIVDDDEDLADTRWSSDNSDRYKHDAALNDKVNSFLEKWAGDWFEVVKDIQEDLPCTDYLDGKSEQHHVGCIEEVFDSMELANENDFGTTACGSKPLTPTTITTSEIHRDDMDLDDMDLDESACTAEDDDEDLSYSCAWLGVDEPWQTEAIFLSILALKKLKLEEINAERWYTIELNRLEVEHVKFEDSRQSYVKRRQNGRGSLLRNEVSFEDIKIPVRTLRMILGPAFA